MSHFLTHLETPHQPATVTPHFRHHQGEVQAQIEISPGHSSWIAVPLTPGCYEHLSHQELREVLLFLRQKCRRSSDTLRRYSNEIEKFLVFLKTTGHTEINDWVLAEYQDALLQPSEALRNHPSVTFRPVRPETADQYLSVIRSFSTWLFEKNLLGYNPAKQVPNIGTGGDSELMKCFTREQWQAVNDTLEALPDNTPGQHNKKERLMFCIRFSYALGLRIRELRDHSHQHIRYRDAWRLEIIGKGLRRRHLYLETVDTVAMGALTRYRQFLGLNRLPEGEALPLLPRKNAVQIKTRGPNKGIEIDTRATSASNWEQVFKDFIRNDVMGFLYGEDEKTKAAVYDQQWRQLTPHSLRHTRITHLVEQGKDLFWVQKFAGHENLNTTQKYFHLLIK